MSKQHIIVVYKKSTLQLYQNKSFLRDLKKKHKLIFEQLQSAHDDHYRNVDMLLDQLKSYEKMLKVHKRGVNRMPKVKDNDLVISLGGDGTFIYASHYITHGSILGVNSAPDFSVGHYCKVNLMKKEFKLKKYIDNILSNQGNPIEFERLQLTINKKKLPIPIVNDMLVMDSNPASTSRYILQCKGKKSQQRSSGIWISTAAGSSAAYKSSGGKVFKQYSSNKKKQFGFRVRELYSSDGDDLTQGLVQEGEHFQIDCGMIRGNIFLDGGQKKVQIKIGDLIEVEVHNRPLYVHDPGIIKK